MNEILASLVALLVVAVLVALAARRLKLPYTVGLVATGTLLAWLRLGPAPPLTRARRSIRSNRRWLTSIRR